MRRAFSLVALLMACVVIQPAAVFATHKRLMPDGNIPARWNLPKPMGFAHADQAPASAGGSGDGVNYLSFAAFDDGDMVVTGGTATGHAGEWDDYYAHGSICDSCIWSANVEPVNGVQREAPRKYRAYDYAWGIWVPSVSATRRTSARSYCRSQIGEPYDIASSKSDQSSWYCSKLCWSSYRYTSGIDLDGDGGYWVWPIDLVDDGQTSVFASSK